MATRRAENKLSPRISEITPASFKPRPVKSSEAPDLKLIQLPIGPIAVFGASNFPLAFSAADGDTAAALTAGCPVVGKGHPAHPGTGEIVAEAIDAARRALDLHPGVFGFVHDGGNEVGGALVQKPPH